MASVFNCLEFLRILPLQIGLIYRKGIQKLGDLLMLKELFYNVDETGGACSKHGNGENEYRTLGENPKWE